MRTALTFTALASVVVATALASGFTAAAADLDTIPAAASTIAVLPLANKTEAAWLSGTVLAAAQDVFVTELVRTGKYSVLRSGELASRLRANKLSVSSDSSTSAIAAAGRQIGVDILVTGLFSEYGSVDSVSRSGTRLRAQAVDSASGRTTWSGTSSAIPSFSSPSEANAGIEPVLRALVAELKAGV